MKVLYLHGLDSSPLADKAVISRAYADAHDIAFDALDLNCPPDAVIQKMLPQIDAQTVLIGSSLGGYFANILADQTGAPCILLNPSIRPDVSFLRFVKDRFDVDTLADDTVIYTTTGGWDIQYKDLAWFVSHPIQAVYADRVRVLLKLGDELLDAQKTRDFYQSKGVFVEAQDGGDHGMSDYAAQVEKVFLWARQLIEQVDANTK